MEYYTGLLYWILLVFINDGAPSSSAASIQLTEQEERLLGICRSLNDEGCERLVEYGDDLVASRKYIKSCSDEVVEG